jgi:2,4-dienoyl-CoA reductase-like NADH-dependent reductase (Old Yellow Enzyme family)
MSASHTNSRVFTPLQIGPVTVKNRVLRTAHGSNFSYDGTVTDAMIAYHLARAEGEVALTVLEGAQVHRSSGLTPGALRVWDDSVIPSYQRLMAAINPTGMKVFQQIWHGGAMYADWREPPMAPSALPSMYSGVPAREITHEQIKELVDAFAQAAHRCEQGGLHGCEVAGSHGYLVTQFLSPWSNQRQDAYGGTLEKRARFLREVLAAIRAKVSSNFAVGMRMGAEVVEGGLTPADMIEVIKLCRADGVLDFVDLSVGAYHNVEVIIPALHAPAGVELNWNSGVREQTGAVTFVTGRFRALDEAEQLLASGEADMVGMTRATIADPHLVKKTLELGPDAVRPCIGCNQLCVGNIFSGQPLQCTVNAMVGREAEFAGGEVPAAKAPKRVLVVGGGPAGLEAARVAASAGHQVELHEATPDLGGAVRLTKPIPHLSGLADITHWLADQVYQLQVSVHTSSFLEAADILEKNPDVVLIAAGSVEREDGWQLGAPWVQLGNLGPPRQLFASDVLAGRTVVEPGRTITVVDDTGHAEAAGVAEYLLSKGAKVDFVTRFGDFAPQINIAWRSRPSLRRLNATGRFTLHTHAYVSDVAADGVVEIKSFVGEAAKTVTSDHILFVGFNTPQDALAEELAAAGYAGRVELVGDSKSPRYLPAAIHEGFSAALTL